MDLFDKIELIRQMIQENSEYTIRDYLETLDEIEHIKSDDMPSRKGTPNLTEDQKKQIVKMATDRISVPMIARIMKVQPNAVYTVCAKCGGGIEALREASAEKERVEFISSIQKHAS